MPSAGESGLSGQGQGPRSGVCSSEDGRRATTTPVCKDVRIKNGVVGLGFFGKEGKRAQWANPMDCRGCGAGEGPRLPEGAAG